MSKTYIRLDKINHADPLESAVAKEVLKNGQFVDLGVALDDAEGEAVEATKAKEGKRPDAVMASVFIDYGELNWDITEQELDAGKAGRAVLLKKGHIYSLNAEIAKGVKKGDNVTVGKDGLGLKKATESDEIIGTVIREDYLNFIGDLVVIRIK